jgi:hypothetical protein
MDNDKAIVTLAIGKRFRDSWKETCQDNWGRYAKKHGYDVICIDTPLDTSDRAQHRSPAWQKCLILSQEFSPRYRRIVWIDADILINSATAPDICEGVELGKVGAVEMMSTPTPELHKEALERFRDLWGWEGTGLEERGPGRQYYVNMGMRPDFDQVVHTGALVLSPEHHRALLEKVYYEYEDKGGRKWHMEMPALSYELLKADKVQWIDGRFNVDWNVQEILHYPFLANQDRARGMVNRFRRQLNRRLFHTQRACMTASFSLGYFLHIGGGETLELMKVVDTWANWTEILL